ncbi:MAG: hypothetical protein OEL83_14085 [Desulforhopalus sp.]|nr:hypothetical protein [Desulforhopalus sp.]
MAAIRKKLSETRVEPGQTFVIDAFKEEDAEGIAGLFYAIYGPDYPIRTFYHPERIIRENRQRTICSAVARTPAGDIVAHGALYLSSPFSQKLYEIGLGLTLPSYRETFATYKVFIYLAEEVVKGLQPEGIFGEAVCNHIATQKLSAAVGMSDMAVELGLMPASAYEKEQSAQGRVTCTMLFKSFATAPADVYVPQSYFQAAEFLLGDYLPTRTLRIAKDRPPKASKTELHRKFFPFAQTGRCNVTRVGADFKGKVGQMERLGAQHGVENMQFFINAAESWSGYAVDFLQDQGYFFGGLLPNWFHSDGILMQKHLGTNPLSEIHLYSKKAKRLLDIVLDDKARRARH